MHKASWKKVTLAESKDVETVEGNFYFPMHSINQSFFLDSQHTSVCPWKGTAHYYHIKVGDEINKNAAWYYPETTEKARNIEGYIAFWKGVKVE